MRSITLRAPAKVNLTLHVHGRRADGYRELDTVMMALELADRLTLHERAAGSSLRVSGPAARGVPTDETNLALRAVAAVRELALRRGLPTTGVALELEKHIPTRAGLGGGSSDAAAAALGCALLWGLDPDDGALQSALGVLGSDCAFFLAARRTGLARCTGRGELVEPLAPLVRPWQVAVLTPQYGCTTAAVYGALAEHDAARHEVDRELRALRSGTLVEARAALANDLEVAAGRAYAEVTQLHGALERLAPGAFRLAGSGSSWFGFFADDGSARAALDALESAQGGRRYALRGRWLLPLRSCAPDAHGTMSH